MGLWVEVHLRSQETPTAAPVEALINMELVVLMKRLGSAGTMVYFLTGESADVSESLEELHDRFHEQEYLLCAQCLNAVEREGLSEYE